MEKLRNNLFTAQCAAGSLPVRSQQIAEFTLYDGDPDLFNTELQTYLA